MEQESICLKCEHELREKGDYIRKLEKDIDSYEEVIKDNRNEMRILEVKLQNKEEMILELENNFTIAEGLFH